VQEIIDKIENFPTKTFDMDGWQKFFDLSKEISHKHYPGEPQKDRTVEEFRRQRLDNAIKDVSYSEYVVFLKGKAIAWIDESVWNKQQYFGFDTVYNEIDAAMLKAVLVKFDEIMNKKNFSDSLYYTYRETIFIALKKAGAAVEEEYVISRIERKDMDSDFYKGIVSDNPLEKWMLEYYAELPENLLEPYARCHNECLHDMFAINPYPAKLPDVTTEYIKTVMETHKKNGTTNPMYILFDDAGEIAGLCSICIDSFKKETLRHVGSLTVVPAKYRGKGIAKYLKAKLYLKLLEENKEFKYITTDTMEWNKYMYKINNEFGFKPYRTGFSFRISRDFIKKYLNHIG
jgi:hypothetical protein